MMIVDFSIEKINSRVLLREFILKITAAKGLIAEYLDFPVLKKGSPSS